MDNTTSLLVTLSNGDYLLKVAMKVPHGALTDDAIEYSLEPENKKAIHALLPLHCQSFGAIVEVDRIFEVKDLTK